MSLVAYGDSDDGSSDSEGEENTNFPLKTLSSSAGEPSSSSGELLQEATPCTSVASDDVPSTNSAKRSRLSSLLPKPNNPENATTVVLRSNFSNLDTQNLEDDEDEIVEVEEEYVPLSQIKKDKKTSVSKTNEEQKSVGSLFSRMPSPWSFGAGISLGKKKESGENGDEKKYRKGKQPVRIVAPTISQDDLDDDDDKGPAAKKPMKSKTGSGLSSILPKPKHSITPATFNPNKPTAKTTNRSLIPHTLTKKPEPAKKDPKRLKKSKDDGSGDEEDNEPVSFFSFSEKNSDKETNVTKDNMKSEASSSVNILGDVKPIDIPKTHKSETITGRPEVDSTGYSTAMNYGTLGVESTSASAYGEGSSHGSTPAVSQYYDISEGATTTYYQTTTDPSQHYAEYGAYSESAGYYDDGAQGMYNQTYGGYAQGQAQPEDTDDIDMEKLKRLQGKSNRNEQINIIDINAADQTGDTQLQMTKITSEQIAHRPSKKKGNMPSSQQRRKHQITYLAYQAKEKEFELQQQWSSNRQTKRQTQAKYGF